MFKRQSDNEGYLLIDHRDSPGLTAKQAVTAGRASIMPHVAKGRRFEGATLTCSHCERIVIKNLDRARQRAYCPKCNHFICDWCEAERVRTGQCKPFKQVIDEFYDAAAKGIII